MATDDPVVGGDEGGMAGDTPQIVEPDDSSFDLEPTEPAGLGGETGEEVPAETEAAVAELVAYAEDAGLMDRQTAAKLNEAGVLDSVLAAINRRDSEWNAYYARMGAGQAQAQQPPPAGQGGQQQAAAQPQQGAGQPGGQFEFKLDFDEYGPELGTELKRLNQHYAGRQAELDGQLQQMQGVMGYVYQNLQHQRRQAASREFDALIETAGKEYADELGTGPLNQVRENRELVANRARTAEAMQAVYNLAAQRGEQLTPEQCLQRACQLEFGGNTAQRERRKIGQKLDKRSGMMTTRPTQTERPMEESADERTRRRLSQMLRDDGIVDEDAGLPTSINM